MSIINLPYKDMISVIIGIISLLPIVGSLAGAAIGGLTILISNPVLGIIFLIYIFVLQQIVDDFIYPRIVGNCIAIQSIFVLFSISIGGYIGLL